jgi:hypothetical protein
MSAALAPNRQPACQTAAAPIPLRCHACQHLVTRHNPDHVPPAGTSARCAAAREGKRLIGYEWQPNDAAPPWCPKRSASR